MFGVEYRSEPSVTRDSCLERGGFSLHHVDYSLEDPAANLALDELLYEEAGQLAASGQFGGLLRFWECSRYFVVLGVSCRIERETLRDACERDGVPILRRASGGGTVLQGPGCLNFTLILPWESEPHLRDLQQSYVAIVERCGQGLGILGVRMEGSCDLAIDGRKFSGSAQKRGKHVLLHQGSLLYDFDLSMISQYLRAPPREPEYRGGRTHSEFLCNAPLDRAQLVERIVATWESRPVPPTWTAPSTEALVREKYGTPAWNGKF